VQVIKSLGLQPRRTIRAVAWMNEENGLRGAEAYLATQADAVANHVAVIEADSGAGRPLGLLANTVPDSLKRLQPVMAALKPFGATVLKHVENGIGADISGLQERGVPGFEPYLDGRTYFHYHHTAADTLDKVDPELFRRQVALLAVLSYALAEMPEPLPRMPVKEKQAP
jgi:carboxypeptidase Q